MAVFTTFGCEERRSEESETERFDSAGIEIVFHSSTSAGAESPVFSVRPEYTVGDSPEETSSHLFRVAGAALLPAGRLVVANGGRELLFFGSSGKLQTTAGRSGEGPGEFRSIDWIGLYRNDSVAVFDAALRRFSVFDSWGRFSRSFDLVVESGEIPGAPRVAGVLADGSVLFRWLLSPPMVESGLVHQTEELTLYQPTGTERLSLGRHRGEDIFFSPRPGGKMAFGPPPFSPEPVYVAAGERFYFTGASTYEVRILDALGQLELIVRVDHPPKPITEVVIREFLDARLSRLQVRNLRREAEEELRSMVVYDHLPVIDGFQVDDGGEFWVRAQTENGPTSLWDRFSPDGAFLGCVKIPTGGRFLDLHDNRIALLEAGPQGEQLVRVFRLAQPAPAFQ
jgi:hypothetical protein